MMRALTIPLALIAVLYYSPQITHRLPASWTHTLNNACKWRTRPWAQMLAMPPEPRDIGSQRLCIARKGGFYLPRDEGRLVILTEMPR